MNEPQLKAPFPWFGGKRRCADVAWRAFGHDTPNYVEPFAGSLAVLLGRPGGSGKIETVNDIDRYLSNFWRAMKAEPESVAEWANDPVNEADLHARHKWLVNQAEFRERMHTDPDFYDVKVAGWWVWGICQWIGAGWCVDPAAHAERGRRQCEADWRKRPQLDGTSAGQGVHREGARQSKPSQDWDQRPHMTGNTHGVGVHRKLKRQLPKLSVSDNRPGMGGVFAVGLPALGNDRGLNGVAAPPCLDWFLALQTRLRRVRVACGDWTRVLGDSVLGKGKNVGGRRPCAVFLDPPYSHELRGANIYSEDDAAISGKVREWALKHGDDPDLRIALCGYLGEHEMPKTWTEHAWKAARGYAGEKNENRKLERIWFSPHCLPIDGQRELFANEALP